MTRAFLFFLIGFFAVSSVQALGNSVLINGSVMNETGLIVLNSGNPIVNTTNFASDTITGYKASFPIKIGTNITSGVYVFNLYFNSTVSGNVTSNNVNINIFGKQGAIPNDQPNSCLQENTSTNPGCTNNAALGWYGPESITNSSSINDSDYSTFGFKLGVGTADYLVNYTIPSYNISNIYWQVKTTDAFTNYTIPNSCRLSNTVQLKIVSGDSGLNTYNELYCTNTSASWQFINGSGLGSNYGRIFEEAIIWNYTKPISPFYVVYNTLQNPVINSTNFGSDRTIGFTTSFTVNASGPLEVYEVFFIMQSNLSGTVTNYTSARIAINITGAGPSDSCTYTSGNWLINCSDSCNLSSDVNLGKNNITFYGGGDICYQESATTNTTCAGGVGLGGYSVNGTPISEFANITFVNDSDYSTFSYINSSSSFRDFDLYINYTKPIKNIYSALWQVKTSVSSGGSAQWGCFPTASESGYVTLKNIPFGSPGTTFANVTIPGTCLQLPMVRLKISVSGTISGANIYEEGIIWQYSDPMTITANITNFTIATARSSCQVTIKSGGKLK